VDDLADQDTSCAQDDRFFSLPFGFEEDTGFIRKGTLTGTQDKLMNVNLFFAARYSAIKNNQSMMDNVDGFDIPFARLNLAGSAFTEVAYHFQYDFDMEEITEATIGWNPSMSGCPILEDFHLTAGLTKTFLSPASQMDPWELDFIEYPRITERFLASPEGHDIGVYVQGDALDQGRLKIWLGAWNGAHRMIPVVGANPMMIPAFDAWGNGTDNDSLAAMGRVQVNVLDEEDYFLMFSGSVEKNRITYYEWAGGMTTVYENRDDTIYDVATEFRFLQRKGWVKSEYMHSNLRHTNAPTQKGYYLAGGYHLPGALENFEVMARYDRVKLNDNTTNMYDFLDKTVGVNFYFDPEHKHDAKVQVNYLIRETDGDDNAFLVQFVTGF
jgi:hypothetical protein